MTKSKFLPYGRQQISEDDIHQVTEVLRSDWLTQGPAVPAFEGCLADYLGASECVACSSGTAALHLAVLSLGLGEGDAIVTTPNTFLATANCARFVGADVVFADIDPATGLIDPTAVVKILEDDTSQRIKAVIPVHFAGQPADLPEIAKAAWRHGARIIDDASHAIGAGYEFDDEQYRLGANPHSDLTVFSFHPIKHVAMGEGGAVATNDAQLAERMRRFRNHGIARDYFQQEEMAISPAGVPNPWYYEMAEPGFNYRLTDIQAALGRSQLSRLPESLDRRRQIAALYRELIASHFPDGEVRPLTLRHGVTHAYHLFVVQIDFEQLGVSRAVLMNKLRAQGIGTQVHYIPINLQPYYRRLYPDSMGNMPGMMKYYSRALSLPMFPELTEDDINRVVTVLAETLHRVEDHAVIR